jgi:hypothetical protein
MLLWFRGSADNKIICDVFLGDTCVATELIYNFL